MQECIYNLTECIRDIKEKIRNRHMQRHKYLASAALQKCFDITKYKRGDDDAVRALTDASHCAVGKGRRKQRICGSG